MNHILNIKLAEMIMYITFLRIQLTENAFPGKKVPEKYTYKPTSINMPNTMAPKVRYKYARVILLIFFILSPPYSLTILPSQNFIMVTILLLYHIIRHNAKKQSKNTKKHNYLCSSATIPMKAIPITIIGNPVSIPILAFQNGKLSRYGRHIAKIMPVTMDTAPKKVKIFPFMLSSSP